MKKRRGILLAAMLLINYVSRAQDGNTGLNQANTMLRGYYDAASTLLYGIGGLVGLIGAVKVFSRWIKGDRETDSHVSAWIGACIFLVVCATLIRSFFGL